MQKVILLEGNPTESKSLARFLTNHEYNVETADDAKTVLQKIKLSPPDMILLDLTLPKMDGLKLLETLRKRQPEIPVVVFADKAKEGNEAIKLGAREYVRKPIDNEELEERVGRILAASVHEPAGFGVRLKELHDEKSGRIDAVKVAIFLGVSLAQLAESLGAKYTAVHKTPAAPSLQEGLAPIKRSLEILSELISDPADIRAWLNSPHPDLEDRTPIQVILEGHAGALRTILENAISGIPT